MAAIVAFLVKNWRFIVPGVIALGAAVTLFVMSQQIKGLRTERNEAREAVGEWKKHSESLAGSINLLNDSIALQGTAITAVLDTQKEAREEAAANAANLNTAILTQGELDAAFQRCAAMRLPDPVLRALPR